VVVEHPLPADPPHQQSQRPVDVRRVADLDGVGPAGEDLAEQAHRDAQEGPAELESVGEHATAVDHHRIRLEPGVPAARQRPETSIAAWRDDRHIEAFRLQRQGFADHPPVALGRQVGDENGDVRVSCHRFVVPPRIA
jgi:hypothetical protein